MLLCFSSCCHRSTSCSAPRFSVVRWQSLLGNRTSHPSGSRPEQRETVPVSLPAPGQCLAPENRRCHGRSTRAAHRSCGSPAGPTPSWLLPWAVAVPLPSARGRVWVGQRPIRSGGSEPTPNASSLPQPPLGSGKCFGHLKRHLIP
jgi:hypothetical protein